MENNTPYDFQGINCSREAFDINFSYFSAEEIKQASACHIVTSAAFEEPLMKPHRSGVYSDLMGPVDLRKERPECPTCGLIQDCPGHLGHIELVCPVYNPFLFLDLFKLLKRTCIQCGRLKAKADTTERVIRTLISLLPGELPTSTMLPALSSKKPILTDTSGGNSSLWFEEDASEGTRRCCEAEPKDCTMETNSGQHFSDIIANAVKKAESALVPQKEGDVTLSKESASLESFRSVLAEYIRDIPTQCANCGVKSAKWRKDGYSKLFIRKAHESDDKFCLPVFVKKVLKDLWENEKDILRWMIPGSAEHGHEIFFLDCLLVPPNRFRPPQVSEGNRGGMHNQTEKMQEILNFNNRMRIALSGAPKLKEDDPARKKLSKRYGEAPIQSAVQEFQGLQEAVNSFLDSTKGSTNAKLAKPGIRQLLEKKEGMFRMKMMGKRVNFAARSVISPDPNIETTDIGIPFLIAKVLTYAEVANNYNVQALRSLILRGDNYPGAVEIHIPKSNGSKQVKKLAMASESERAALAKQLLTDLEQGSPPTTVMRHIVDGDPLLVNRQPTLHKPGIMAHIAKVMTNDEKTIRLHYANCSTYNADFDGDEMNLHAPQDPISRIEALTIAKAEKQYLVPTSGKPLRGLIQDHVIAGVMLTRRDSYLTKSEVCQLLYTGLRAALEGGDLDGDKSRPGKKKMQIKTHSQKIRLHLDTPAVCKPRKLYTGKQVLSMLLKNIFIMSGKADKAALESGMNFTGKAKTPGDIWQGKLDGDKEENTVVFQGTELLMASLTKTSLVLRHSDSSTLSLSFSVQSQWALCLHPSLAFFPPTCRCGVSPARSVTSS
jgi:DNA-directed RNA polymerase I subunit RPA1